MALKPGRFVYISFKYGTIEGEQNGRWFCDFTGETFTEFLLQFSELSINDQSRNGDSQLRFEWCKVNHDMLLMIRDKTQGNLTGTEEKFLGDIIASLQKNYTEEAGY